jgi:hypothetical protein
MTDACTSSLPSCMNCDGVSGTMCRCGDAGVPNADGGLEWQCIGTGEACTGGTFHG